ncbi:MAG TPA: hypothetical protein VF848_01085 [Steroidobacteraceae bacterium]
MKPVALALGLVLAAGGMAKSADKAPAPVDPALLEFLGSVDSDDAGWNEYLAHVDPQKVAAGKTPVTTPAPKTPDKVEGT